MSTQQRNSGLEHMLTRASLPNFPPQQPSQSSGFVQRIRTQSNSVNRTPTETSITFAKGSSSMRPSFSKDPLPALAANPQDMRRLSRQRLASTSIQTSQQQPLALLDKKLQEWQAKPKNLSPATELKLEPMIPPPLPMMRQKMLLVLDVDETLVHASFTPEKPYNVKITIEVDGEQGDIFVAFRPHLFTFLEFIAPLFEVAIFTASQSCYADQLMDHIDPQRRLGRLRLFREHCTEITGGRVKDLSLLGRPLDRIALIDNSPVTYLFQPRNAIPILSWFDDPRDAELLKLMPMLRQLAQASTVYDILDPWHCQR